MKYWILLLILLLIPIATAETISERIDRFVEEGDVKIVYGGNYNYYDFLGAAVVAGELSGLSEPKFSYFPRIIFDQDISSLEGNIILVGGPCANKFSNSHYLNCEDWNLEKGQSIIANTQDNIIVIAGSTQEDTLRAARVLKEYDSSAKITSKEYTVFTNSINIKDAYSLIIDDYKRKDNLVIVPSYQGAKTDFPAALALANNIWEETGSKEGMFPEIITEMDKLDIEGKNVILLGGPCANAITEEIITETYYNCNDWQFSDEEAIAKVFYEDQSIILLIAGTGPDPSATLSITEKLKNPGEEFEDFSGLLIKGEYLEALGDELFRDKEKCEGAICTIRSAILLGENENNLFTNQESASYTEYLSNSNPNKNCYRCFMEQQSKEHLLRIIEAFGQKTSDDDFEEAEIRYLLGKMTENEELVCSSLEYYESFAKQLTKPDDLLVVYENLLFVANECLPERERNSILAKTLALAEQSDFKWKTEILDKILLPGDFEIEVEPVKINNKLDVPKNPKKLTLGLSKIEVNSEDKLGMQVERTTRDWFSLNLGLFPNFAPNYDLGEGITWMEGNVAKEIITGARPSVTVFPNTLIVKKNGIMGEKWYATDENGVFRFEVLPDKVQYPTTKCIKNICLLVDTHGISSLVAKSVAYESDLVLGCGDYYDKMDAAYYLAQKGKNVFFPCDRFVAEVIGHDAKGILIGTAPVRKEGDKVIIGDQSVVIDLDEKIVVQNTDLPYPAQYYDAPNRYFKKLESLSKVDLNIYTVNVDNMKQTGKVVEKAKELGSSVIAVRVAYEEDYLPVKEWLEESKNNRAILFHSGCYPAGFKLLREFPEQTSFGDPRPVFT